MSHVTSKDGTRIAYERLGSGPALLMIDGALCSRAFGPMPKIAALLAEHFTVYLYDRRGRGESGDTQPYGKAREVEDIQALIAAAGGPRTPRACRPALRWRSKQPLAACRSRSSRSTSRRSWSTMRGMRGSITRPS